ncbi:hypothetical protein ACK08B_13610 [Pantoea dispersa]|uniref:hypothetical protein n=1 Tax=Pantoea dispersa TaxID=59814 RepID=UPI0021AE16D7|nr:hypothetical protein [Pantoea dispersa]
MVRAIDINTRQPIEEQEGMPHNPSYGDGDGGGGSMLEARVAKLESDVSYIRRDVDELKADVKSIDRNMVTVLEKLESIKESLAKKPSTDTVDRKISEAKLAVLLGVPALIAIGTGAYKLVMHLFFS